MHRIYLILLGTLLSITGYAQDDALFYIRDDSAVLTLTKQDDGYTFAITTLGKVERHEYQTFSGSLTKSGNTWTGEVKIDEKDAGSISVTGKPGAKTLELEATELVYPTGNPADAAGTYNLADTKTFTQSAHNRADQTDAVLNKVYAKLKSSLSEKEFKEVREGQRNWIHYRDQILNNPNTGEHGSVDYWEAFARLTTERCEFLNVYTGKEAPKGRSAVYIDSEGGELTLKETDEGLSFSITVVRGPTYHVGDISGTAKLKGNKASWKDTLEEGDDREPSEIKLTFLDDHRVQVEEKNTEYYRGVRAYFEGTYFKARKLQ